MMRGTTLLWGALAIACGIALFLVKYEVQNLEDELRQVQREVRADRETIHILEAEWTYLNDPERLARLAERVLGLQPVTPEQVVTVAALPERPEPPETMVGDRRPGSPVPWASFPRRKPGLELASARAVP